MSLRTSLVSSWPALSIVLVAAALACIVVAALMFLIILVLATIFAIPAAVFLAYTVVYDNPTVR